MVDGLSHRLAKRFRQKELLVRVLDAKIIEALGLIWADGRL
jgi:hypothetical protein